MTAKPPAQADTSEPAVSLCRTSSNAAHILQGVLALWEIRVAVIQVNPARLAMTIAELIVHESDHAPAVQALRDLKRRRLLPDWCCHACKSLVPGTFDECWNCGEAHLETAPMFDEPVDAVDLEYEAASERRG